LPRPHKALRRSPAPSLHEANDRELFRPRCSFAPRKHRATRKASLLLDQGAEVIGDLFLVSRGRFAFAATKELLVAGTRADAAVVLHLALLQWILGPARFGRVAFEIARAIAGHFAIAHAFASATAAAHLFVVIRPFVAALALRAKARHRPIANLPTIRGIH